MGWGGQGDVTDISTGTWRDKNHTMPCTITTGKKDNSIKWHLEVMVLHWTTPNIYTVVVMILQSAVKHKRKRYGPEATVFSILNSSVLYSTFTHSMFAAQDLYKTASGTLLQKEWYCSWLSLQWRMQRSDSAATRMEDGEKVLIIFTLQCTSGYWAVLAGLLTPLTLPGIA